MIKEEIIAEAVKTISKITSGRFIAVVLTTATYCSIVAYTTVKYLSKSNPDKIEGFAVGLVMGFAGMAGIIYKSYFDIDRKQENGKEQQK